MKQAVALFLVVLAVLELAGQAFGHAQVLLIVLGAMSIMAVMIGGTFLWLWFERTTPLALGMVYTWAGTAIFIGWWWGLGLAGAARSGGQAHLALVVHGTYIVGALLHFAVIHRSFGLRGPGFLWPVAVAFALSGGVALLA